MKPKDMKLLIQLQLIAIVISWLVTVLFFGISQAWSVALGGLTYCIPTILSILALSIVKRYKEILFSALFFIEVHKIVLIVVIIVLIYFVYPGIHWLAYLVGLIIVTQVGLLMFRKNSYYE